MQKKLAVLVLSVALVTSLVGCAEADAKETVQVVSLAEQSVETLRINSENLNRSLSYNGVLSAKNIVHLASKIPGEIIEVPVKVGDVVEENDPIYVLNKDNVKRSVRNASLSLEAARHQLNSSVDQNNHAIKTYERMKSLYENPEGSAISQSQYEQAELGASKAGVEAANVQLSQAQIGLEQAKDQLTDADLKTPITGIVSVVNVEPGQSVGAGQHIADVINMDQVYVDIQVAENVISSLHSGDAIEGAIPALSSEKVMGNIEWVSPAADLKTRLFPVRVMFENENHEIKPGMFVDVRIDIEEATDAIVIPSTAILDRTDGKIVYLNEGGIATIQYVTTGFDNGEFTVILDGLSSDDEIIIEGQQFIEDGTPLKVNGGA